MEPSVQVVKPFNIFDIETFENVQRIAKTFVVSDLVPDIYRASDKNPIEKAMANVIIALEVSSRIGASPMMIMQNLNIVMGKPGFSAKFLIASVNSTGQFEPLQFKFTNKGLLGQVEYTEYTWDYTEKKKLPKTITFDGSKLEDMECVCYTTRKGSEEVLEGTPISIKMAIQEGWYTKAGSKWKTMPKLMLTYRAASFWVSAYSAGVSLGLKTTEEIIDITEDVDFEDVSTKVEKMLSEKIEKKPLGFNKEVKEVKESKEVKETKPEPKEVKPEPKESQPAQNESQTKMDF